MRLQRETVLQERDTARSQNQDPCEEELPATERGMHVVCMLEKYIYLYAIYIWFNFNSDKVLA